jgi:hypothetical protein
MQKIVAFLHKFTIPFNILGIIFWSYLIITRYNSAVKNDNYLYYIIPVFFILLSIFNLTMAFKRKERN